jgi:hypothetical protein
VDIVVAELNVSLTNIDLMLVVQIITDLQLTGQVQAVQDDLTGELRFDQGRMIAAAFDTEHGLAALELIFLTMPDSVCTFSAELPVSEPNIDLSRRDLDTYLHELSRRRGHLAAVHNVLGGWAKTQRTRPSDQGWVAGEAGRRQLRPSVLGALMAAALFVCLALLYLNGVSSESIWPESQPAPSATDTISASKVDASGRMFRTVFEERFTSNVRNWPNNPDSTAWIADRTYQLFVRRPGQFIAIGAPLMDRFKNVVVTGRFRKTGGPAGGAYGLLVRDQGPGPRDGLNQTGTYYVLGVSDQGVAIRRRDGDHWVDVAPWKPSSAVSPNGGTSELTALAMGQQLTLVLNGTVVATARDNTASEGTVGIFTSGDLNEVGLEQFIVEVPTY